jgi:hypothetical protein
VSGTTKRRVVQGKAAFTAGFSPSGRAESHSRSEGRVDLISHIGASRAHQVNGRGDFM